MSSPSMPADGPLCLESSNVTSFTALRAVPPQVVLDQLAAAARIAELLHESGRKLRFFEGAHGERTRIELHDSDDQLVSTMSASDAVELAAGMPLSL